MWSRSGLAAAALLMAVPVSAQLPVARDTIQVLEAGQVKKMPWAGGINYVTASNADLNGDGRQDLVLFEKQNTFNVGRFRCFIHTGALGQTSYRYDAGLSYYFPRLINWAIMRDFDGDGRADIFCSTNGGIKVYRNVTAPQATLQFEVYNELLLSNYFPYGSANVLSNLYAGTAGVPGIADVDNDQDLDILTFTPLGVYLELHRNMSREKYGTSDSLVFQRDDNCWGDLSESECTVKFTECASQLKGAKTYHSGACVMCIDSDGDLDQDLIMGDMSCTHINYVHNDGAGVVADFADTTQLYPNYPQKNSNSTHIRISHFPCAYVADADADGRMDLFASPNAIGSENYKSLWLYRNSSTTPTVNFQLQQKNFLQDEMIDVGQNAFPVLMDTDGDGLRDLLVGTYGYFNAGVLTSSLSLYRNTGSATAPAFSLVTRDYMGLSASNLPNMMPAAGDVDGDGDEDLLFGTSSGKIHWLPNTAGAGNPSVFGTLRLNPFNFTTPSSAAAPQLFDLDDDGRQDLLIGMKNGKVAYYRNTGTAGSPTFSLVTAFLGNIDVRSDASMYGPDGYAVPFFYRENNATWCLIGSVNGDIWLYAVTSPSLGFGLITARVNGLSEGSQSTVWYEDINSDGRRDLFIGQAAGGLSFFSSASPYVGISEPRPGVSLGVAPNPSGGHVKLLLPEQFVVKEVRVFDVAGNQVTIPRAGELQVLDVSELAAGVYFLQVHVEAGNESTLLHGKFIRIN